MTTTTYELVTTADAFRTKLLDLRSAIGPQPFEWYPYDSFGYMPALDALLKGDLEVLKCLVGKEPVLDVGCGDGALSFFMESLGCRVDAIDHPPTNHNWMKGVARFKEALRSSVAIHAMDIDARFQLPAETYGLTLLLGILYHLKNPFYVLETLAAHSRYCLLGTRVARVTPLGAKIQREALAYLVDEREMNDDPTNYWIFSEEGLKRIMRRAGWNVREFFTAGCMDGSDPVRGDRDERAFCLLESRIIEPRDVPALLTGWHELEDNWRWTAREFSVRMGADPLAPPTYLELRFSLMEVVVASIGPVTLQAKVNGKALARQTFAKPGEHVYRAALPAGIHHAETLLIDFALDKAYKPGGADVRELGLLISFYKPGYEVKESNVPVTLL